MTYFAVEVKPRLKQYGDPRNEVQLVLQTVNEGTLSGGTFTLTLNGSTTGYLAWNATASVVQTALEGLASMGAWTE